MKLLKQSCFHSSTQIIRWNLTISGPNRVAFKCLKFIYGMVIVLNVSVSQLCPVPGLLLASVG